MTTTGAALDQGEHLSVGDPTDPWTRRHFVVFSVILLAAASLRVALLPTQGLRDDLDLFASWIHRLATDVPLGQAYDLPLTFPPLMTYLFWLMGVVQPAFETAVDASEPIVRAAIKLPASVADLCIAALVVAVLRDRPKVALGAATALLLVPSLWYVSAWWGQFESIYTLFGLLAAVLAIRGRWLLAGIALGLALSTKPQAVPFIIPFAAWAVGRIGARSAATPAAATLATVVVMWLPFLAADGPAQYLANVALLQGEDYAILSIRAWNFWWIVQEILGDGYYIVDSTAILGPLTPRLLGLAMTGIAMVSVFLGLRRRASHLSLLVGLAAATLGAFLLLTTMHDRYSFPSVPFLLAAALVTSTEGDREAATMRWILLAASAALVLLTSLNFVASAPPGGEPGSLIPVGGIVGIAGSIAFLVVGAVILVVLVSRPPRLKRSVGDA